MPFHELAGRHLVVEDRYVMYGEWRYAKHTVYYDALPHYSCEFDVLACEALTSPPRWRKRPEDERTRLFAAALLHDVASRWETPDPTEAHTVTWLDRT